MAFPVAARSTGTLITASIWNADLKDNLNSLYAGAKAIASQAALDFIYAGSTTQEARLAAAARKGPRLNDAGTAWVMTTMPQPYTPTVADVSNTASETTTISWTVGANEMADGDVIRVTCSLLAKNDTGGTPGTTVKLHWGASSTTLSTDTWTSNATEHNVLGEFLMQRVGADLWVRKRAASTQFDAETSWPLYDIPQYGSNSIVLATPTFSSSQTVAIKITFASASASLYWKTQVARVWRFPAA